MILGRDVSMHTELEAVRPYKILVVDDDPIFQQTVKRFLSGHGYDVLLARSTMEAEPFLRDMPDLLIVDYRMPGADGAAWIKNLRERGFTIPIVFCTASTYSSQFHANLRNVLKVDLIIRKPIIESDFIRQLQALLPQLDEIHEAQWVSDAEPLMIDVLAELLDQEQTLADLQVPQPVAQVSLARHKTMDAVQDLATLYLTELPEIARLLRKELTDSREHNVLSLLETAESQVHLLSGASGTLGFTEIHEIAQRLQACLHEAACPGRSGDPLHFSMIVDLLDSLDRAIRIAAEKDGSPVLSAAPPVVEVSETVTTGGFLILSDGNDESRVLSSSLANYQLGQAKIVRESLSVFSILAQYRPEILFIDVNLSGLTNAYDICRMIRCNHLWTHLKIIFTLDTLTGDVRQQIFECGGDDFVLLPINETELSMRVSQLLSRTS